MAITKPPSVLFLICYVNLNITHQQLWSIENFFLTRRVCDHIKQVITKWNDMLLTQSELTCYVKENSRSCNDRYQDIEIMYISYWDTVTTKCVKHTDGHFPKKGNHIHDIPKIYKPSKNRSLKFPQFNIFWKEGDKKAKSYLTFQNSSS